MEHFFILLVGSKRLKRLIHITLLLKLKVSFWRNFWGNHTKYLPTQTKWFSQAHQRATFQSSLLLVFPKSFVESYVMLLLKEKYKISLGVQYFSETPLHKVIFRKAWKRLSRHLLVRSQQWKHENNVWNLFKVINKNIRTTSMTPNRFRTLFSCFHC